MSDQLSFLNERSDPVLLDFLRDRRRLLTMSTLVFAIIVGGMFLLCGWDAWPIAAIVALLDSSVWYEYTELIERVRTCRFGEHPMDYDLLQGYFASRGIRTELPSID
jgi:hypothetical protein